MGVMGCDEVRCDGLAITTATMEAAKVMGDGDDNGITIEETLEDDPDSTARTDRTASHHTRHPRSGDGRKTQDENHS